LQLETILKVFFLTTQCLQLAHKQNINPREIPPTHPGEMLREGFMPDYNLTTTGLVEKIGFLNPNSERAVVGALCGVSSHGLEAIQTFWKHSGVLVKCTACGGSLEC